MPLFEKAGNKFSLTDAGAELRNHAQRFAAQAVTLIAAMQQFQGVDVGILRLSVVSTANYFLPPLIATLSKQHPRMRITLQVANHEAVLNSLIDSVTDLAITGQPPESAELIAQPFKDNPLVVIAPPDHRLARQHSVSMNELSAETLVVRESGSGTRAAIERHFADHGQTPFTGCELNTNEAIKQAVQAGLGLAVVSVQTIELELETQRLVILPVEGFPILRRWYLVHRERRLSAAAAAFRDLLLAPLDFDKIMKMSSKSSKPPRAVRRSTQAKGMR